MCCMSHTGCFSLPMAAGGWLGTEGSSACPTMNRRIPSAFRVLGSGNARCAVLRGLFPRANVDDPITNREPMGWSRTAAVVKNSTT
jgi:hypothetical protein